MSSVDVGGLTLYFEQAGTGERLLFISGTGSDLRQFPSVFAGPLGPWFEILAYDQRGLGRSGVPPGPYTMADYANDADALLEHVGWDSCLVMGVSFGGMVGQELAIRFPERVERLVLACTSSGGAGGASIPFTELDRLEGMARVERHIELMDTRWDATRRRTHPKEWEVLLDAMAARSRPQDATPDSTRGAALQLEARSHHHTWDRLHRISCPTLVCAGRYDGIAAPANSERLAERIPAAELECFEGGHIFLWQDQRAYERIITFLRSDGSPDRPRRHTMG